MAMRSLSGAQMIESKPKKTKQGMGKHTSFKSSPNSSKKKRLRGQGRG